MTQEANDEHSDEHSDAGDEEMEDIEDSNTQVESSTDEHEDDGENASLNHDEEKPQYGNQKKEKKEQVSIGKTRIWKQTAAINSLLKKGRLFEIRKLLKRLSAARAKKGNEAQLAKNARRAERLLQEVEALKAFTMEALTQRTVAVLRGTADGEDAEFFSAACTGQREVDGLLQRLSAEAVAAVNKEAAETVDTEAVEAIYGRIAYLRILSCAEVLAKLKLIRNGVNVNPKKNKPKAKRSKSKQEKNAKNKFDRTKQNENKSDSNELIEEQLSSDRDSNGEEDQYSEMKPSEPKPSKAKKANRTSISKIDKNPGNSNSIDEHSEDEPTFSVDDAVTFAGDSFFLDSMNAADDGDVSTDDEFSAPVVAGRTKPGAKHSSERDETSVKKKPNRMGQRRRRQLLELEKGAGKVQNAGGKRHSSASRGGSKSLTSKFTGRSNTGKPKQAVLDEPLHPSWIAKQKAKKAEAGTAFAGTKITFDDD